MTFLIMKQKHGVKEAEKWIHYINEILHCFIKFSQENQKDHLI